jgi:hypothetical protein
MRHSTIIRTCLTGVALTLIPLALAMTTLMMATLVDEGKIAWETPAAKDLSGLCGQ